MVAFCIADGKDGHGLKFEKNSANFFKFLRLYLEKVITKILL